MKTTEALIGALVLFASASALAAQETPWFVGVTTGYSWLEHDVHNINSGERINRLKDSTGPSVGIEFGFQPCRYFAISGALHDYGSGFQGIFSNGNSPRGPGTGDYTLSLEPYKVRLRGASVQAMRLWPVSDRFRLFGKLGILYTDLRYTWTRSVSRTETVSDSDLLLGVGAEYGFAKRWSVRLEYQHAQLGLGTLQGGVYWHF
ncbi:MAG: porin family protein [Opitutaceae bacterium]|nr:porin family protein [Opitutaceae bacterium]